MEVRHSCRTLLVGQENQRESALWNGQLECLVQGHNRSAAEYCPPSGKHLSLSCSPWTGLLNFTLPKPPAAEALRLSSGGSVVWWVADHSGGAYYGLQFPELLTGKPGEIQFAVNRSEPGSPDAIILSRCDIFDSQNMALNLIRSGSYKKSRSLQAFEIWEK